MKHLRALAESAILYVADLLYERIKKRALDDLREHLPSWPHL
ncbi:Uncharacterised protein [Mycobacteroides abscessus subsp. abscessus]|nr:hypothetical protein [Mycobacteroides abscessus]SIC56786.1 Uncharacterised protein [Mycobacteroides abscessus subsp. abscessus]SKU57490.1 Uncharacterised protein [Mycobacteroides abscessus subsp. abscessus]